MIDLSTFSGRSTVRQLLRRRHPWLDTPDVGPRSVTAGECDRCGAEPRMVELCGPTAWTAVGRRCATELGSDGWCTGHAETAARWRAWLDALPREADAVTRLWWVTTGEVALPSDPDATAPLLRALGAGADA